MMPIGTVRQHALPGNDLNQSFLHRDFRSCGQLPFARESFYRMKLEDEAMPEAVCNGTTMS